MLKTAAEIEALYTGFSTIYRSAYDSTPEYSPRFATQIPSSSKMETYGWMTRIPKMREWVGERVVNNLNSEAYTLYNKTFEETVGMDVDDLDDDNLGVYNPMFAELGRVTRKWKDQQTKEVMQAGVSNNSFDGVPFFSTAHPINPAGNQSNLFTSTPLTPENYNTVQAAMASVTGSDGEPLGASGTLLVVPPQLKKPAMEILNSDLIVSSSQPTTDNVAGVRNVLQGSADLLVVPELSNEPTTWYLMDVTKGIMPFIFQTRMAPQITPKTSPTDDNVFNDNQYKIGAKARGAAGYGLWWLASRCTA